MKNNINIGSSKQKSNDDIDLNELIIKVWTNRKTILIYVLFFFLIGVCIVAFSPKKYKSEITLVVETNSSVSGISSLLQQFGGISGISLDKKGKDALSPELYPEVVQSTPFLLEILKQKVTESKYDSTLTVADYIERHTRPSPVGVVLNYTIGLPGLIIGWLSSEDDTASSFSYKSTDSDSTSDPDFSPIKLSKQQAELVKALSDCIKTEDDFKKTNKFIISVEMQDPQVVAQVTSYVVKSLTKHIITYRTKKATTDMIFVSARTSEAEEKYLETQQALASFKDKNKNVILSSVLSQEDQLQSEYDLAFDLYTTLSKQLEQSKIKVQDETPVFNVVNPAQIPLKKSGPRTSLILGAMIFLGFATGIGVVFGKSYYLKIKSFLSAKE